MKKDFLKKNCPIGVVYLLFIIYLISGFVISNSYKIILEIIHQHSYVALLLLFVQLVIWKKDPNRKFLKNRALLFLSLLVINFYLLCDSYLFSILIDWFDIELVGYLLNALAIFAGLLLIAQSIIWFFVGIKTIHKKLSKSSLKNAD